MSSGDSIGRRSKSHSTDDGGGDGDDGNEEEAEGKEDESDGIVVIDEDNYSKKDERKRRKKEKKRIKAVVVSGCKRGIRNAKSAVLILPLRRFQKLLFSCDRRSHSSPPPSVNVSTSDFPGGGGRFGSCKLCLCVSGPQTSGEDDNDGVVSKEWGDPDDTETSLEALRVLVEQNDFFAKECNTHLGDL